VKLNKQLCIYSILDVDIVMCQCVIFVGICVLIVLDCLTFRDIHGSLIEEECNSSSLFTESLVESKRVEGPAVVFPVLQ